MEFKKLIEVVIGANKEYENGEYKLEWCHKNDYLNEDYSVVSISCRNKVIADLYISKNRGYGMSIEDADTIINAFGFTLVEGTTIKELSLEEIADKFGIDVKQLRIKN